MRPPGYEPGELPTAPPRDVSISCLISNCGCKDTAFLWYSQTNGLLFCLFSESLFSTCLIKSCLPIVLLWKKQLKAFANIYRNPSSKERFVWLCCQNLLRKKAFVLYIVSVRWLVLTNSTHLFVFTDTLSFSTFWYRPFFASNRPLGSFEARFGVNKPLIL